MGWFFKAFAGLFAVSGLYVGAVAQGGLKEANKNLCDLVNSISPWDPPGCEMQTYIAWAWLVLAASAAIYLVCLMFRHIPTIERRSVRLSMLWLLAALFLAGLTTTAVFLVREGQKARAVGQQRPEDAAEIESLRQQLEAAKKQPVAANVPKPAVAAPPLPPAPNFFTSHRAFMASFSQAVLRHQNDRGNSVAPLVKALRQVYKPPIRHTYPGFFDGQCRIVVSSIAENRDFADFIITLAKNAGCTADHAPPPPKPPIHLDADTPAPVPIVVPPPEAHVVVRYPPPSDVVAIPENRTLLVTNDEIRLKVAETFDALAGYLLEAFRGGGCSLDTRRSKKLQGTPGFDGDPWTIYIDLGNVRSCKV